MVISQNKKIILIFVEGVTEDACLDPIIDSFNEKSDLTNIEIKVQYGDIFTDQENTRKNGQTILKDQLEIYLTQSRLKPKDILHVAFITDTDGIYQNPTSYLVDSSIDNFIYNLVDKKIICQSREKTINLQQSRQTKAKKLSQIIKSLTESQINIKSLPIPYSVHYNSLNLEHVLFDQILSDYQKVDAIYDLLDKLELDPIQIMKKFQEKAISEDYLHSWLEIQKKEMTQSYSNLNILFNLLDQYSHV